MTTWLFSTIPRSRARLASPSGSNPKIFLPCQRYQIYKKIQSKLLKKEGKNLCFSRPARLSASLALAVVFLDIRVSRFDAKVMFFALSWETFAFKESTCPCNLSLSCFKLLLEFNSFSSLLDSSSEVTSPMSCCIVPVLFCGRVEAFCWRRLVGKLPGNPSLPELPDKLPSSAAVTSVAAAASCKKTKGKGSLKQILN